MSSTTYTLIGTPFSTFTRSIALGLKHKGIPFEQISTLPRTELAKQYHPYGFLPTLVIHTIDENGNKVDIKLRETQAIARYLDVVAPEPSLNVDQAVEGPVAHAKVWESVSVAASSGYPIVEVGVVKPRLFAMIDGKLSEEEMDALTVPGLPALKEYITITESLLPAKGEYLFGASPTWADFFLFPLLADLRAIPQWSAVESERLKTWMIKMDELPAVKATSAGTLSVGDMP